MSERSRLALAGGSIAAFVALAVAANWLTATYGLIPIGFGLTTTAGTYAAGLVLVTRDVVQDAAGRIAVLCCIATGAALSIALATPQLAVASGCAFAVSELADYAVYAPLRRRGWARAVIVSSVVGSAVDSALFLTLARFPVWQAMPGQMLAKTAAVLAVVSVGVVGSALLRQPQHATGA
jgi:uncharacterized PurR-regulated membrane protein YhhQ (DUF165 family)